MVETTTLTTPEEETTELAERAPDTNDRGDQELITTPKAELLPPLDSVDETAQGVQDLVILIINTYPETYFDSEETQSIVAENLHPDVLETHFSELQTQFPNIAYFRFEMTDRGGVNITAVLDSGKNVSTPIMIPRAETETDEETATFDTINYRTARNQLEAGLAQEMKRAETLDLISRAPENVILPEGDLACTNIGLLRAVYKAAEANKRLTITISPKENGNTFVRIDRADTHRYSAGIIPPNLEGLGALLEKAKKL